MKMRFTLRRAVIDDADFLWRLANDAEVRRNSFVPDDIPWDELLKWVAGRIDDSDYVIYIAEDDNGRIGTIRFGRETAGTWTAGVSLVPSLRGKGVGGELIARGTGLFFTETGADTVKASIKPDNTVSLRAFSRAGYRLCASGSERDRLQFVIRAGAVRTPGAGTVCVGDRLIGAGRPALIVAEISANHNGSFERAAEIVRAAKTAGADAVKLQTYTPDTLTIDCDREPFRIKGGTLWDGRTLYDLYREAYTPWEWQPELKKLAEDLGLLLFSSPFDATAVEFLEKMDVPAHKIASLELVDDELLARVAETGKPVFLATGLADAEEVEHALEVLDKHGSGGVILLHCVSAYPARTEEMNLRTLPDMAAHFGRPFGLSDHSTTQTAVLGAVALGACTIEKHFTLDRAAGGFDAAFSLEPTELEELVEAVRAMESALGGVQYGPTEGELASLVFRRSLCAIADINEGGIFTRENIRSIRPGSGLPPRFLPKILGRVAKRNIERGEGLDWSMIAGED